MATRKTAPKLTQAAKFAALQTSGVDTAALGLTETSSHKDLDTAIAANSVEVNAGKSAGKGTSITVTVRTAGKLSTRTFSAESNGKDWRKVSEEFIETSQTKDEHSASRSQYVSHVEE